MAAARIVKIIVILVIIVIVLISIIVVARLVIRIVVAILVIILAILGTPVVPFCPFHFGVSLFKLNSRKKGTNYC